MGRVVDQYGGRVVEESRGPEEDLSLPKRGLACISLEDLRVVTGLVRHEQFRERVALALVRHLHVSDQRVVVLHHVQLEE